MVEQYHEDLVRNRSCPCATTEEIVNKIKATVCKKYIMITYTGTNHISCKVNKFNSKLEIKNQKGYLNFQKIMSKVKLNLSKNIKILKSFDKF